MRITCLLALFLGGCVFGGNVEHKRGFFISRNNTAYHAYLELTGSVRIDCPAALDYRWDADTLEVENASGDPVRIFTSDGTTDLTLWPEARGLLTLKGQSVLCDGRGSVWTQSY